MADDVKPMPNGKRRYDSPRRRDAARQTRAAVVEAAITLFGASGYAATSLQAVADEAGVAVQTIYATFESKAALLSEALDVAIAGDHLPVVVNSRAWMQRVWQAPTAAERLQAYAKAVRRIMTGAGPMFLAVSDATGVDDTVRALAVQTEQRRHQGAEAVVRSILDVGRLRPGLTARRAADLVSLLNSPHVHRHLVGHCGWSPERYERWLATCMIEQLVDSDSEAQPAASDSATAVKPRKTSAPRSSGSAVG